MKAVWYAENGPAAQVLRYGDLPEPVPACGEVKVRVKASGINPSDVKTRAGTVRKIAFERVVPHSDGAGVIEAVGEGVSKDRIGQKVWIYNGAWQRQFGTAAQYICLPSALALPMPGALSFEAAACIGIPVMTAHRAVFADGGVQGRTVLVQGGAGAVGHYAIQLAKWGGAQVVTTVSSQEKAAYAASAGADLVVNYKSENTAERIREFAGGAAIDRIVEVDLFGNLALDTEVLNRHGIICVYGSRIGTGSTDPVFPTVPLLHKNATLRMVHLYDIPASAREDAIRDINAWIGSGRAKFSISGRYRLDEAVAAHEAVEGGTKIGQVVLQVD